MATRLTLRRLRAIQEALSSRLAGEIDIAGEPGSPSHEDYETASDWVAEQIARADTGRPVPKHGSGP